MEKPRRDFLRVISTAAALPALAPILKAAGGTGSAEDPAAFPAAASRDFRAHFPMLKESVNGQPLVYLDSAAPTQRPREVVDALSKFYLRDNANPAKSLHTLASRSAAAYDAARAKVARFLNARGPEEIVWTRGTTEAINLVAASWGGTNLGPGDEVLVTVSDHYSNLVPWQLATRRVNASCSSCLLLWLHLDRGNRSADRWAAKKKLRTLVRRPHAGRLYLIQMSRNAIGELGYD